MIISRWYDISGFALGRGKTDIIQFYKLLITVFVDETLLMKSYNKYKLIIIALRNFINACIFVIT